MCAMIRITDEYIQYAENILFGKVGVFDAERKDFIKNLETIDLQAVPGSGKTTALLAKLLILEKFMPFLDGSGVLVLSHTNAAVDEICNKIGKHCPKLFGYPNFVGTIQSFVDSFLAIPFYTQKYNKKTYRIDDEIYYEKSQIIYSSLNHRTKQYLDRRKGRNNSAFDFFIKIRVDNNRNLLAEMNGSIFLNKTSSSNSYNDIIEKKEILLSDWGVLSYDDAYLLAEQYVTMCPQIKILLQKRFKYVFVDEMQDMDIHQYDLLEKIFYDKGNSSSVFQRIGDKNQAIFNGSAKLDEIWNNREHTLYLTGSHRLNSKTAPLVEKLALTPNEIVGRNKNEDNSEIDIKPHIIVFDDTTITNIIPKFAEIIENFQKEGKIPQKSKNKFMAIAWRKEHEDQNKLGLVNYWNDYSVVGVKKQIDVRVLKDYLLVWDREKKTLESVRKNILNAFLKIMRLENILDENNRFYTKRKLLKFLKENFTNEYEDLKLHIYKWSIGIIKGRTEEIFELVKGYIPTLLQLFDKEISHSNDFINSESEINVEDIAIIERTNIYKTDNIEIEIGTIHSAKGQTHTATLYLETFYQGKYESEYLKDVILGNAFVPNGKHQKQATKIAYVGFSRPTHLLCVAIHKDRFERNIAGVNKEIWEVIELD